MLLSFLLLWMLFILMVVFCGLNMCCTQHCQIFPFLWYTQWSWQKTGNETFAWFFIHCVRTRLIKKLETCGLISFGFFLLSGPFLAVLWRTTLLVNLRSKLQSKALDRYLERASIPLESLWKVAVVVEKIFHQTGFQMCCWTSECTYANINREKNELFSPISDFGPMVLIVLTDLCTRFLHLCSLQEK